MDVFMSNDQNITLSRLPSFGDVAAEDDAVLDYFLSTNAVSRIAAGEILLVLGRKGTGKTAIVRYFTEKASSGTFSRSLNLKGYPWNIHAKRKDSGASDIEAYVASWRYVIAIQLASIVVEGHRQKYDDNVEHIRKFLTENYGGLSPKLNDILTPARLKLNKLSLMPSILGNQIGGIELERAAGDHRLGLELNALTESILSSVFAVAIRFGIGNLSIHFDELDQGLASLDDQRKHMLIGLIIAARDIRKEARTSDLKISPIVYLRTDIWEELNFSDKNKISQTLALQLVWDEKTLLELVEVRLSARFGVLGRWATVAEANLMRGSQTKWNHVLARTFLRPRDVIRFLNAALHEARKRPDEPLLFSNPDIVNSRGEYSFYLKNELDDEIRSHWSNWDDALQSCSAISTITFDKDDFVKEYIKRKSKDNALSPDEALKELYRFSVIGYEKRSGYGGSSWSFQYTDRESGWDNAASRFKVHLGLKEYAKLREARQ